MLSFKRVSHTDRSSLEEVLKVTTAASAHDRPGFAPLTYGQIYVWRKHPFPGRFGEDHLAYLDGEPVGWIELGFTTLDNLHSAYLDLQVVPSARRRGVGRALYELAVERVRAEGRNTILTRSVWSLPGIEAHDGGAGPAFAQAMGLESANLPEVMRRLELSTVDNDLLDDLYAKAEVKAGDYQLVRWKGRAPDELVNGVAYLDSRLISDAPMGDLAMEPEKVDAERIRGGEEASVIQGRSNYHTGAVHTKTGQLAAWTTLSTQPKEVPWHAWQFITIVDPDHRGHRLGALVKVANLRYFTANEPQVKTIDTFNAAENSYMIAINEEMGFRPRMAFQNWQTSFSS